MAQIPVLMFHHVNHHSGDTVTITPEVFSRQMEYLHSEGYETLSAAGLVDFIQGGGQGRQKRIVLTFDDGWLDNYLYAVPVLAAYSFKATFFIITGRVDAASSQVSPGETEIPDHETAKALLKDARAATVALSWALIRTLEGSGLFGFYSHTVNHRKCAELSAEDLRIELTESKKRIEMELGRSCHYLCWPYGSFSQESVTSAAEAGYEAVFTSADGYCVSGSDPFMINRIEVQNSVEWLIDRLSEGNI